MTSVAWDSQWRSCRRVSRGLGSGKGQDKDSREGEGAGDTEGGEDDVGVGETADRKGKLA